MRSTRPDALQQGVADREVATLIHDPTLPNMQLAYQDVGLREGSSPIAELLHREVLGLHFGPVMANELVDAVIYAVRNAVSSLE